MFAQHRLSNSQRRGVVLIVILGMLALLALIGVTFATISGQAKVNGRNFFLSTNTPDASTFRWTYALGQVLQIVTTPYENPMSAIRGHSFEADTCTATTRRPTAIFASRPDNAPPMPPVGNALFYISNQQLDPNGSGAGAAPERTSR